MNDEHLLQLPESPTDYPHSVSAGDTMALIDAAGTRTDTADRYNTYTALLEAAIERKVARLAEVRRAAGLTQVQLAAEFGSTQPDIAKLESRGSHLVSTLDRFITATGGHLRMLVEFDDGTPTGPGTSRIG